MIFIKNFKLKKNSLYFISFIFLMYYCCSINLKRQSEHSGLRPDTSSLVWFFSLRMFHVAWTTFLLRLFEKEPTKMQTLAQTVKTGIFRPASVSNFTVSDSNCDENMKKKVSWLVELLNSIEINNWKEPWAFCFTCPLNHLEFLLVFGFFEVRTKIILPCRLYHPFS